MRQSPIGIMVFTLLGIGLACWSCSDSGEVKQPVRNTEAVKESGMKPHRLDSYTIKGLTFTYYSIPAGLGREELIATAQALRDSEPNAQLILVDDGTQLKDYINYVQEFSRGDTEAYYPLEWAKRHVIANLQKYVSGKWMLCEGVGANEIAELR